MEASHIIRPYPLTYDDDIYWAQPVWNVECRISRHVLHEARFDAREYTRKKLAYAVEQEAKRQQWGACTWRDEERLAEYSDIVIRRMVHQQPGFRKVEEWAAPGSVQTIRVMRRNDQANLGDPVEAEEVALHPLWYRGRRVRGALIDDVLYIVA